MDQQENNLEYLIEQLEQENFSINKSNLKKELLIKELEEQISILVDTSNLFREC